MWNSPKTKKLPPYVLAWIPLLLGVVAFARIGSGWADSPEKPLPEQEFELDGRIAGTLQRLQDQPNGDLSKTLNSQCTQKKNLYDQEFSGLIENQYEAYCLDWSRRNPSRSPSACVPPPFFIDFHGHHYQVTANRKNPLIACAPYTFAYKTSDDKELERRALIDSSTGEPCAERDIDALPQKVYDSQEEDCRNGPISSQLISDELGYARLAMGGDAGINPEKRGANIVRPIPGTATQLTPAVVDPSGHVIPVSLDARPPGAAVIRNADQPDAI